jgi:hypothetical protein
MENVQQGLPSSFKNCICTFFANQRLMRCTSHSDSNSERCGLDALRQRLPHGDWLTLDWQEIEAVDQPRYRQK